MVKMSIIDFFKNVKFQLNLFDLILVIVVVLVVKKIVLALKTERKIDERLRETKARISRVVKEIEQCKDGNSEVVKEVIKETTTLSQTQTQTQTQDQDELTTEFVMETLAQARPKDTKQLIENDKKNTVEEVLCIQEVSEVAPKGKKTRAMSMEERWAEFDKKRSMRNTA